MVQQGEFFALDKKGIGGNMTLFSWFGKKPEPFSLKTLPKYNMFGSTRHKGKIALVLGGGGAYGRFEIGAIKYLQQIGMLENVDMICGTSAGGLNALFTAANWGDFDTVLDLWTTRVIKNTDIYEGEIPKTLGGIVGRFTGFLCGDKESIVKAKPLYKLLDDNLGGLTFDNLRIPTYITATDISRMERFVFSKETTPAVQCQIAGQATSAICPFFRWVDFAGKKLADGGVAANNPVELAVKYGATKIILIGCTPDKMPQMKITTFIDAAAAELATALHLAEEKSWEIVESGKVPYIGLFPEDMSRMGKSILDFDNLEAMQYGYDMASRFLSDEYAQEFLLK
jgi:predicted acylesterase/phospholipase RssA